MFITENERQKIFNELRVILSSYVPPLHIKIDESRRYDTAVFENIRQVMDKGIRIYEEEGWV
ncbi:hypothetical protein [Methanococcoides sp.]|uniref:hypothetical protein n=1 Tax=Methanococcoides sp. TaxID=1966350 RepID=UPI00272E71E4|nr:hypothetical protein [Methanococcoides sp.]